MRQTNRTLVCDRCGTERTVNGFAWTDLHGATSEGWVKYVAVTARTKIDQFKFADLCPDCAVRMARVMEDGVRDHNDIIHDLHIDIQVLTDEELTTFRDYTTKALKYRRTLD